MSNGIMINLAVFDDVTISWKAKGIYMMIVLLNERKERVSKGVLVKLSTDGIQGLISGLKELQNSGYLVLKRNISKNCYDYILLQ